MKGEEFLKLTCFYLCLTTELHNPLNGYTACNRGTCLFGVITPFNNFLRCICRCWESLPLNSSKRFCRFESIFMTFSMHQGRSLTFEEIRFLFYFKKRFSHPSLLFLGSFIVAKSWRGCPIKEANSKTNIYLSDAPVVSIKNGSLDISSSSNNFVLVKLAWPKFQSFLYAFHRHSSTWLQSTKILCSFSKEST